MVMRVLLYDNPNGYAVLFAKQLKEYENYDITIISEKINQYDEWIEADPRTRHLRYSIKINKILGRTIRHHPTRKEIQSYDVIVCFTKTGLSWLSKNNLKFIYYNIGGFKENLWSFKQTKSPLKKVVRYYRSLKFKRGLKCATRIVVSNQMDFEHVFYSNFNYKIHYVPMLTQRWNINVSTNYTQTENGVIDFIHISSQNYFIKGNDIILEILEKLMASGHSNFHFHLVLWGKDQDKTKEFLKTSLLRKRTNILPWMKRNELENYVRNLSKPILLGEFSDYSGPGTGGAVRELSSAGIPCITYAAYNDTELRPQIERVDYVVNSTKNQLYEKLLSILKMSNSELKKLSEYTIEKFNEIYNPKKIQNSLKELIDDQANFK